jgi:gluconate 2-dehydrogenase gamma chain
MKRRVFIKSSIFAGTALALLPQGCSSNIKIELFKTLEAVQEVLFPKGLDAPAASVFGATAYLANVSSHSSFLASDLRFLKHGMQELMNEYPHFLTLSFKEQEAAITDFSQNDVGRNWIAFVLYFTIEGLFADPIYGGNKNESGWKWLGHNAGQPRPKKPFAELLGESV